MCVLLINPPSLSKRPGARESFIARQKRRMTRDQYYSLPIEHLGIMSIAAAARRRGIDVRTVNAMVSGHESLAQTWDAIQDVARRHGEPTLIGFSNINTFEEISFLVAECRRSWEEVRIVLGNTFATLNWERVLRECNDIDFVIVGEGEVSFTSLADAVLNSRPIDDVPGLAWRQPDGSIRCTPPTVVDLDDLPWVARDELPTVLREGFAGAVYTSRGCPYRCTFCGTGAVSALLDRAGYRIRSIQNVVDELEYLATDFGVDFVSISDDLFLTKSPDAQERATTLADELLRRNLRIRFMFDIRLDSIVDLDVFARLRRAGLQKVFIGLETGSYDQLMSYRKRSVKQGEDPVVKVKALRDMGIEVIPGTIMFHPFVTPDELRETLRLLNGTGYKATFKLIDRIAAYAGTPLQSEYAAKGWLTKDWPIGEWEFADPQAQMVYEETAAYIGKRKDASFDEVASFFLERVADWEAVLKAGQF